MPAKFVLVRYGKYNYHIVQARFEEVAGHFDIPGISPKLRYFLHTEYSFGPRKFSNTVFDQLPLLRSETFAGIPLLWINDSWSESFFKFLVHIIAHNHAPRAIEIHPPFKTYCDNSTEFLLRYQIFEELITEKFPKTEILVENRLGTQYKGSFLICGHTDIEVFLHTLAESDYKLKFTLDLPQLLETLKGWPNIGIDSIQRVFERYSPYRKFIRGMHIWGHRGRAHIGDLNSLFNDNVSLKNAFLEFLSEFFDDGITRYLVPEVNGTKQQVFDDVIKDLAYYFTFI